MSHNEFEKVRCEILKSFPFSVDGVNVEQASKGGEEDIPAPLVRGLEREGYVRTKPLDAKSVRAMPENKAIPVAEENKTDTPPDGWQDLHWKKRVKLAEDLTGKEFANLDDAEKALNELADKG